MNIVFVGLGSHGDVNPHLAVATEMKSRGHDITFATIGYFESLVRKKGFEYSEILDEETYHRVSKDPDIWHPKRGFEKFAKDILVPAIDPVYECIEERHSNGGTVVVAPSTSYGARIAHDKLQMPLFTLNLQPGVFRSEFETPAMPGVPIYWWTPRFIKRWMFGKMDKFAYSMLGPGINGFREKLGLDPVHNLLEWCHSPYAVIACFPEWYASIQPDWPPNTHHVGFPIDDSCDVIDVPEKAQEFLDDDAPFIAFTAGSANRTALDFYTACVGACKKLDYRGLLLSPHTEKMPGPLPGNVASFGYVPLCKVMPKASAFVHHGGIGMLSRAMVDAVPQLITPRCYDQPDNAARIRRMGIGGSLAPGKYTAESAAKMLDRLMNSSSVRDRCQVFADKLKAKDPVRAAADLIEKMAS